MRRLLRHSVTHFLLLGAVVYWAETQFLAQPMSIEPVRITQAELNALRLRESERLGRPVQEAEFRVATESYIDDQLLLARAFDLELDRDNPAVENRLLRLLEFLDEDVDGTQARKLAHARKLGLDHSDPVIRRTLVESMRFLISKPGPADLPTRQEVAAYHQRHAGRFVDESRLVLGHVFFSHGREGETARSIAQSRINDFRAGNLDESTLKAAGDAFLHGSNIGPVSQAGIARRFGPDFATQVANLPADTWQGPLASAYGYHLVKVRFESSPEPAPLQQVQNQIVHELAHQQGQARLRRRLVELRSLYAVKSGTES